MRISFVQFSAAGIWGAARLWDVRVLRQEQRIEAALLGRACQFPDVDAVVCWKIVNTNTHCQFSCLQLSGVADVFSQRQTSAAMDAGTAGLASACNSHDRTLAVAGFCL